MGELDEKGSQVEGGSLAMRKVMLSSMVAYQCHSLLHGPFSHLISGGLAPRPRLAEIHVDFKSIGNKRVVPQFLPNWPWAF